MPLQITPSGDPNDDDLSFHIRCDDLRIDHQGPITFEAVLRSCPDNVSLIFGPTVHAQAWPSFVYRYAAYRSDGASLVLGLDPGSKAYVSVGRLRALDLGGRSEREALKALVEPIQVSLSKLGFEDVRLSQASLVLKALPRALDALRPPQAPAAARQDLFTPSDLGCAVDDICDEPGWRHVRLSYIMPRVGGFWTDACTWRVFNEGRLFGLEFRDLSGDRPPAVVMTGAALDSFGPVVRAAIDLNSPSTAIFHAQRLTGEALSLIAALARQTAQDLPNALDAIGDRSPFALARWRHWLRLLPDVLARGCADGYRSCHHGLPKLRPR